MKIRRLTTAGGSTAHISLSLADLADGEILEVGAGTSRRGHPQRPRRCHRRGDAAGRCRRPELRVRGARRHCLRTGRGATRLQAAKVPRRWRSPSGRRAAAGRTAAAGRSGRATSGSPRSVTATGREPCARSSAPSTPPSGSCSARRSTRRATGPPYPPTATTATTRPREVNLEEVYLFRVDPPGGFGVQILYDQTAPSSPSWFATTTSRPSPTVSTPSSPRPATRSTTCG